MADDELLTGWAEVDQRVAKLLREAENTRRLVRDAMPPAAADAQHVYDALVAVRAHQDRVEEIMGQLGRLKDRLRERLEEATEARDDDAARATVDAARDAREYAGSATVNAEARLRSLPVRLAARQAKRLTDQMSSASYYVTTLHRGVDSSRADLRTRLDYLRAGAAREYGGS